MPGFLDGLSELGANINAPMQADPNLNMAALLMGAGLLQPIQPGQTPAGAFGQSLASSAGYLNKARGEQAKLAQEKGLKEKEIGAYEGRTAKEAAGIEARNLQDERQFLSAQEQRTQQHREAMQKVQAQIDAMRSSKELDKTKLLFEGDKAIDTMYAETNISNPDIYAKRDAGNNPIKGSFDSELYDYRRTLDKARLRESAGQPLTNFLPYSHLKVRQRALESKQDPLTFQRIMKDDARVYGPQFVEDVLEAQKYTGFSSYKPGDKLEPVQSKTPSKTPSKAASSGQAPRSVLYREERLAELEKLLSAPQMSILEGGLVKQSKEGRKFFGYAERKQLERERDQLRKQLGRE